MIYSMTGFGKSSFNIQNKHYTIDVKSLNSKQCDVFLRVPLFIKEFEIPIRKLIAEQLLRGKIEININSSSSSDENKQYHLNTNLILDYYEQISQLKLPQQEILSAILKLPNVLEAEESELDDNDKQNLFKALEKACSELMTFRENEGDALEKDLIDRIDHIQEYLSGVKELAPERTKRLREKLETASNGLNDEFFNQDRIEQEIIFYIEKLDITEEFIRLDAHCEYFLKSLADDKKLKGKKLNFISQEIGREINTIGSKANDAAIQKLVVQMKDELEKIKEQVNNVM